MFLSEEKVVWMRKQAGAWRVSTVQCRGEPVRIVFLAMN
jgi:hypothetical protein